VSPRVGRSHPVASDETLARRVARGSNDAFAALYARHRRVVHARCLRILRDREESSDVTQETMVKALRALRAGRTPDQVRPWLLSIAHNEAVSALRSRRPTDPLTPQVEPVLSGADDAVDRSQALRELVDDLAELPESQRGALLLREAAGLAYAEIATTLHISPGNARQKVHVARERLRERRAERVAAGVGPAFGFGWLARAMAALGSAAPVRRIGSELGLAEAISQTSGAAKAAVVATALVAGGGAVSEIGGSVEHEPAPDASATARVPEPTVATAGLALAEEKSSPTPASSAPTARSSGSEGSALRSPSTQTGTLRETPSRVSADYASPSAAKPSAVRGSDRRATAKPEPGSKRRRSGTPTQDVMDQSAPSRSWPGGDGHYWRYDAKPAAASHGPGGGSGFSQAFRDCPEPDSQEPAVASAATPDRPDATAEEVPESARPA
jgi:RNA polymerase sigma factor (sigma-70 family)